MIFSYYSGNNKMAILVAFVRLKVNFLKPNNKFLDEYKYLSA